MKYRVKFFKRNDTCVELLFRIIRYCFKEGSVPEEWQTSVIIPLPKSKSDPFDPLSFRPISLISVPCKIYADILNKRLTAWLEHNDILVEEQNGFRANRSCLDHLYALTSLVKNRKLRRKNTYVCFIDAKKAFDSVNRDLLWHKLMRLGISGPFIVALKSLYNTTCSAVYD